MGERMVPEEMTGCWLREWIRFSDGRVDDTSFVMWLQTERDMVDIRISADRPSFDGPTSVAECTEAELLALAESESSSGFTTATPIDIVGGVRRSMAEWHTRGHGVNFQPVTSYPEPGWMTWNEAGDVMWEAAPSGAYEEEWRLVPGSRDELRHVDRGDGLHLYVAGSVAVRVRDRTVEPHRAARLPDLIVELGRGRAAVEALVECEFSYAVRGADGRYVIAHSTLPWNEGGVLDVDP